ncbi:MAG TPA: J domain-containing protein [bacterium]|nr:J domain-containing protein [bacterium]
MTGALSVGAALVVLELGDSASRNDVRRAYRRLARQWHPDKCHADSAGDERMRELNAARDTLLAYCDDFRIPLADHAPGDADAAVLERFRYDWCWGDGAAAAPERAAPRRRQA